MTGPRNCRRIGPRHSQWRRLLHLVLAQDLPTQLTVEQVVNLERAAAIARCVSRRSSPS